METKLEQIKKITTILFYCILIASMLIFTFNYGFTDWEKVSEEFSDTFEESVKVLQCEVEYKDFRFQGMCNQFDSLNNTLDMYVQRSICNDNSCNFN